MKEWILSFLFLTLVVTLLSNLTIDKKFEKYTKLFISLLVLSAVLSPIVKLFNSSSYEDLLDKNQLYFDSSQEEFSYTYLSDNTNEIILSNFEGQVASYIKEDINKEFNKNVDVEVIFEKNSKSENFSLITNVNVSNALDEKENILNYISKVYSIDKENILVKE